MFYILYFQYTGKLEALKQLLSNLFTSDTEMKLSNNELLIITDWATLRFSNHGPRIDFAKEDYGLPFSICAWIDITSNNEIWSSELLKLTDNLLNLFAGACILEANGEKPILLRNQSGLFVDRNLGGSESMPFELLKDSWTEITLERPDNS